MTLIQILQLQHYITLISSEDIIKLQLTALLIKFGYVLKYIQHIKLARNEPCHLQGVFNPSPDLMCTFSLEELLNSNWPQCFWDILDYQAVSMLKGQNNIYI